MTIQTKKIKDILQYLYIFFLLNVTIKNYNNIDKKGIKYSD